MYITKSTDQPTVLALCLISTLLPLYIGAWHYRVSHQQHGAAFERPIPSAWSESFVDEWLDTSMIEPFSMYPLQQYCNTSTWRPNLVLNLDDANGGIGNIRANFLDFVFYAIEAGASIMLPSRATRSQTDHSNVWDGRAAFDTFFDEDWFLWIMNEACPQMAIYIPREEHEMLEALPGRYDPHSRRMDKEANLNRVAYLTDLEQWLTGQERYKGDEMVLVNWVRTIWQYDTRSLPPGVRRSMSQILTIKPSIRRLAAKVVQRLSQTYNLTISPRDQIPRAAFYGAHLRTESDAAEAGWLDMPNRNFSAQTDAYLKDATGKGLGVMYVASGNATELERFRAKAVAYQPPVYVVSKLDLLDGQSIEELDRLTWDQQALIDFEVLQRCTAFGGFVRSSFSYNIALTRNQWLEDRGLSVDPWVVLHSEEAVAFDDGLSRVIGRDELHEDLIPRGMWP